jgi:predicted acylesterase/phospholipase RssA/CRP-like cAMP-binding protein
MAMHSRAEQVEAKELLAGTRLFSELDNDDLDALAARCEYRRVAAGEYAVREGDPADALLILSSGRLRVYIGGEPRHEIASGEVFGEIALLTRGRRTSTIRAVRDSELIALPAEDFNKLVDKRPALLREVTRVVIDRLLVAERDSERALPTMSIAVAVADLDKTAFDQTCEALVSALGDIGQVVAIGEEDAPPAGERPAWVHNLEAKNQFVVYRAPDPGSPWFRWSLRQSDRILLVVSGSTRPSSRARFVREEISAGAPFTNVQLVLLHSAAAVRPWTTSTWLAREPESSVSGTLTHHHVRRGLAGDIARVARLVTGHGYGLVLGGGGPRGFAHLGVMRALDEAKIPVDAVGGTSIGALMGAVRALDLDDVERTRRAVNGLVKSGFLFSPTLPLLALSSGRKVQALLEDNFAGLSVEDCWLPFFSISASLTRAEAVVHDRGSLVTAVRSSLSLPGLLPPVKQGEDLLVDGGLLNNLPIDVMRRRVGGGTVIAVDLGVDVEMPAPPSYQESLPGWRLLMWRLRQQQAGYRIPGLLGVLMRSRDLAGIRSQRELAASHTADLHLHPPVDGVPALDFPSAQHLVDLAYEYAVDFLAAQRGVQGQRIAAP